MNISDLKIGIIGCGNMGSAIVRGIVDNSVVPGSYIFLYDKDIHKAQNLADEAEVHLKDLKGVVSSSDVVIVAVKPQNSEELFDEIAPYIEGKTIISIMAGIKIDTITKQLGRQLPVVRAMPNMAAFVSESMTCISSNELVKDHEAAIKIFSAIGKVVEVSESEMDAVTAVSGSGPAYVFYLAEAMTEAGESIGLRREVAKVLAEQTLFGSALYLEKSQEEPGELANRVASKGGTTEAALSVFKKEGLKDIIEKAVKAAQKRSEQLSRGK